MGYQFKTDVVFNDDIKITDDIQVGGDATINGNLTIKGVINNYPTRAEMQSYVIDQGHLKRSVVTSLPAINAADEHTIYMIKKTSNTPLILYLWYGGVDKNTGIWSPDIATEQGHWAYCQVIADNTYTIDPTIPTATNCKYYFIKNRGQGIPTRLTCTNGQITANDTGYLMIGPFNQNDFNSYIYSDNNWKISITSQLKDAYEEYMCIDGSWVQIGDTSTDLSNFATLEEIGNINKALDEIAITLGLWMTE